MDSASGVHLPADKNHGLEIKEADGTPDPLVLAIMALCERTEPFEHQKGLHLKALRDICSKNWQKPIYDDLGDNLMAKE